MALSDVFATRLKFIREKAELTQAAMADILDVSRGSIGYYENAERVPDIEFLDRLIVKFDVSYEYLMGYSENMVAKNVDIGYYTGLSDAAIDALKEREFDLATFNGIVESPYFESFIMALSEYEDTEFGRYDNLVISREYAKDYSRFELTRLLMEIIDGVIQKNRIKAKGYDKMSEEELMQRIHDSANHIQTMFDKYNTWREESLEKNRNDPEYQAYLNSPENIARRKLHQLDND